MDLGNFSNPVKKHVGSLTDFSATTAIGKARIDETVNEVKSDYVQ